MKKLLLIIVLIALAGGGYWFYTSRSSSTTPNDSVPTNTSNGNTSFRPNPSNATFVFEEGPVTLSAGKNESPVSPGSAFMEETVILDTFAYGDVNGDDEGDTVLLLARTGMGSGTFIYAAAYVSGPVGYRGTNTIFLGDRIDAEEISIAANGTITVTYLDRGEDEPMSAEPTIRTTKTLVIQNNQLVER